MKNIHSYYSPNNLYNKIIEGLNQIGTDLSKVTLDDLQPVDEFHIRGGVATKELIQTPESSSQSDPYYRMAPRFWQDGRICGANRDPFAKHE